MYSGEKKSNVEKALATVKVPERGLTKLSPEQRTWQIQNRRIKKRNSIIYRDWLEAEDKEGAIDLLRERWGFKHRGHVLRIIEKGKASVIPAMAADVKVLRQVKREEVLRDYDSQRAEIDLQLCQLRGLREQGEKFAWVDVEVMETVGGKNEVEIKTKRAPIDGEIRRLEAERSKSHTPEAAALVDYGTKQSETKDGFRDGIGAATDFIEAFSRLGKVLQKSRPVEVEAEIVQ